MFGWPKPQCLFPSWIARTSWRDLSGNHVYRAGAEQAGGDVINMAFRQSSTHRPQIIKTYRCHVIVVQNTTTHQLVVVSFVSYGWFVNPLMPALKLHSNGPLYSNTVIGTLAVDGWAVTFGTVRRGLGGLRTCSVPSSLHQM